MRISDWSSDVASPMPEEAPVTTAARRSGCGSNRGISARSSELRRGGQRPEAADVHGVHAGDAGGVEVVVGDAGHRLLQADARLEPGQRCAAAEVPAEPDRKSTRLNHS